MTDEERSVQVTGDRIDTLLDLASTLSSIAPLIGGPVSSVLGGISTGRKFKRVSEVLLGFAADIRDLQSDVAERYVQTEDFEDLLDQTLRRVASERSEEKRRVYRRLLTKSVREPGEPYNEQLRIIRTFDEMQPAHMKVLVALDGEPKANPGGITGSPLQTLTSRLPGTPKEEIQEMVSQLNDLRVTNMTSLTTMMTPGGAADLRHSITPLGRSLMRYISGDGVVPSAVDLL